MSSTAWRRSRRRQHKRCAASTSTWSGSTVGERQDQRQPGTVEAQRARAGHHARSTLCNAAAASRCRSATTGFLDEFVIVLPDFEHPDRLHGHAGRRNGRRPAGGRGRLVPRQRPPARQGCPTRSTSPCRPDTRWSPTASCRTRTRGVAWTTYEWDAREPMASYLATIDIGQWDVDTWRTESGLPVYDAVDSAITGGLREVIDSSLSRQGEILDVLAERPSARTPSPPSARSSTTRTTCSSRWRPRPGRSTPSTSGSTARATRPTATSWLSTNSHTNGSATTLRWPAGRTSG